MVTHQTFKDNNGDWIFPTDARQEEGNWTNVKDGSPVEAGAVTKMSKSKKNVIDPQDIIDTYGADAVRLFILSDSPPERDIEWTEGGIEGAWRFVNKLHRMVEEGKETLLPIDTPKPDNFSDAASTLRSIVHQSIAGVADDIEAFHMNKSVARIRELANAITGFKPTNDADKWAYREAIESLIQIFNPMMPHLAEELWQSLGHDTILTETPWPTHDETLLAEDTVTIAVQINGKVRATISHAADATKDEIEKIALNDDSIVKALDNQTIKKTIVVPGRIVNVVAG